MANITASMVKELREMTGAGMMECKKALAEADGDMDGAVDVLRTRGLAAVAKKAGRATNEGTVMTVLADDAKSAAVVELNCETDFVGMNDKFKAYAERIAKAALASKPADLEALKAADAEGETVEAVVTDAIHTLGENIQLSRFAVEEGGAVSSYIHGGGKIGVLVKFDVEGIDPASAEFKQYGRDVAMQVAASAPVAANRDAVDPAVVEHERSIYLAQAAESGKPEAIQEKMATGRLEKFFKENTLTEQPFVKNPDQSVADYTAEVAKNLGGSIAIVDFQRFVLGEKSGSGGLPTAGTARRCEPPGHPILALFRFPSRAKHARPRNTPIWGTRAALADLGGPVRFESTLRRAVAPTFAPFMLALTCEARSAAKHGNLGHLNASR